jgi:hypothetical protein
LVALSFRCFAIGVLALPLLFSFVNKCRRGCYILYSGTGGVHLQGALKCEDLLVAVLELARLLRTPVDVILLHLYLERQLLHMANNTLAHMIPPHEALLVLQFIQNRSLAAHDGLDATMNPMLRQRTLDSMRHRYDAKDFGRTVLERLRHGLSLFLSSCGTPLK